MEARQGRRREADKTKEERKEGEIEARRRKEKRVGPSNQARHSSSSLTSRRYKSGRKYDVLFSKTDKRQLRVRPIEWLKLNFATCVVYQTRPFGVLILYFIYNNVVFVN